MALPTAFTWMLVALTLCLTLTGSISEQCTERALNSTVTELHYKHTSEIHAAVSCLSHPDVRVWLRNGIKIKTDKIKCTLDGNRILLEATARPKGCSLEEDVISKLITVECVSLDADDVSTTLSVHATTSYKERSIATSTAVVLNVNSTSEWHKGGEHIPKWIRIVHPLFLLGISSLLFALFCVWNKEILQLFSGDTETVHKVQEDLQDAENTIKTPDGNDGNPDIDIRLRSPSQHSMGPRSAPIRPPNTADNPPNRLPNRPPNAAEDPPNRPPNAADDQPPNAVELRDAENTIKIPDGNDGNPDVHMRLRGPSQHSMVSTDETEA